MSIITAAVKFVVVAKVGELKPGTMKSFQVENRHILVAMVADKYYAADNKCPHMGRTCRWEISPGPFSPAPVMVPNSTLPTAG